MIEKYRNSGYSEENANARVCQDIVLKAIAISNLGNNVTIKGGVVMRRITIEIKDGKIERLSQHDYSGKRIYIIIKDDKGNAVESKIDFGVHANISIEQDAYCFDVCMDDDGASLLINSCEQIFAEKLRSLLRFGPLSTRYKDIFDFCYLKDHVDMTRLVNCIKTYIIDEPTMREKDMNDVRKRIALTFSNRQFKRNAEHSKDRNWLQIDVETAFKIIQDFLETINF